MQYFWVTPDPHRVDSCKDPRERFINSVVSVILSRSSLISYLISVLEESWHRKIKWVKLTSLLINKDNTQTKREGLKKHLISSIYLFQRWENGGTNFIVTCRNRPSGLSTGWSFQNIAPFLLSQGQFAYWS